MSKVEDAVAEKLLKRAEVGLAKYGVTMERTDLSRLDWLIHAQEEAMDLAVYLERLIQDMNPKLAPLDDYSIVLGQPVQVIESVGDVKAGEVGRVREIIFEPWNQPFLLFRVWKESGREFWMHSKNLANADAKV